MKATTHAVLLCHCDETTVFDGLFEATQPLTQDTWARLIHWTRQAWENASIGNGPAALVRLYPDMRKMLVYVARERGHTLTHIPCAKMEYTE